MRPRFVTFLAAAGILLAGCTDGLLNSLQTCTQGQKSSRDQQITACTAVINASESTAAQRAIAFNHRGIAWLVAAALVIRGDNSRELKRAIDDFSSAIALDPRFLDAYLNRGYTWYSARNWERAIEDYAAAIKIDPDDDRSYALRLVLHLRNDDNRAAIDDITQLIRLNPNDSWLHADRSLMWQQLGENTRALADLQEALRIDPSSDIVQFTQFLVDSDDFDGAIAVYSMAIEAYRKSDDQEDFTARSQFAERFGERGYVHFLRGDFTAAAADLREANSVHPNPGTNEIWVSLAFIALARISQDGAADVAAQVDRWLKSPSPEYPPWFDLYLGRSSPQTVFSEIADTPYQMCPAELFVGLWHLVRSERDSALKRLHAAASKDCKVSPRRRLAKLATIELQRMGP